LTTLAAVLLPVRVTLNTMRLILITIAKLLHAPTAKPRKRRHCCGCNRSTSISWLPTMLSKRRMPVRSQRISMCPLTKGSFRAAAISELVAVAVAVIEEEAEALAGKIVISGVVTTTTTTTTTTEGETTGAMAIEIGMLAEIIGVPIVTEEEIIETLAIAEEAMIRVKEVTGTVGTTEM
jgi:hypothetical protein